jgi:hypothetical protein
MPSSTPENVAPNNPRNAAHPARDWLSEALVERRSVMRWPKGASLQGWGDGALAQLADCEPGSLSLLSWIDLSDAPLQPPVLADRLALAAKALTDGGLLMLADLGPGSLVELADRLGPASPEGQELAAWRRAQLDLHDLGDALALAGLAEPVMESESLVLTYRSERTALADLSLLGVLKQAGFKGPDQPPEAWSQGLAGLRDREGLIRLQLEVVLGHAWRMPARKPKQDPQEPVPIRFARRT